MKTDVAAPSRVIKVIPVCCKITLPWGNEDTQTLIDILGKYKVKATFFVVGAWVDKYPESVKALAEAGHEVMSHSDDHAHFSQLTSAQITENLGACNDKIETVTGVRPMLFRCPYGEYDDHVIEAVNSLGMHAIQWDVEACKTGSSPCNARACAFICPFPTVRRRDAEYPQKFPLGLASPGNKWYNVPVFE